MALYFVNFSDFPLLALVVEPVGTISLKIGKKHVSSLLDIKKNSVFFSTGTDTSGTKMGVTTNLSCLYLSKQQFILKFSTFLAIITSWGGRQGCGVQRSSERKHLLYGSSEFYDLNMRKKSIRRFHLSKDTKLNEMWKLGSPDVFTEKSKERDCKRTSLSPSLCRSNPKET